MYYNGAAVALCRRVRWFWTTAAWEARPRAVSPASSFFVRVVSYRIVSYRIMSCRVVCSCRVSDGVERIGSIVAARAGGRAGAVAPCFVLRSWFVDLGSRFVGRGASGPCAGAVTANGQSRLSRLWARSKIFAEEFVTAVDADPDGTSATAGPLKWCDRSVWRVFNPAVSDPGVSASPPR